MTEEIFLAELPRVLTGSRIATSPLEAPAPVTVIDRETIRASGFTEIHDVLRLVPGYLVADWPLGSPMVVNHGLGDAYLNHLFVANHCYNFPDISFPEVIMPIYAYKCSDCGHEQDIMQKVSDAPLTDCPQCGKPAFARRLTAAGIQFKGSGWYATDYKGGSNAPKQEEAPACGAGGCPACAA